MRNIYQDTFRDYLKQISLKFVNFLKARRSAEQLAGESYVLGDFPGFGECVFTVLQAVAGRWNYAQN
jgi:hypothetical protein